MVSLRFTLGVSAFRIVMTGGTRFMLSMVIHRLMLGAGRRRAVFAMTSSWVRLGLMLRLGAFRFMTIRRTRFMLRVATNILLVGAGRT
jgi:hypothetical protein